MHVLLVYAWLELSVQSMLLVIAYSTYIIRRFIIQRALGIHLICHKAGREILSPSSFPCSSYMYKYLLDLDLHMDTRHGANKRRLGLLHLVPGSNRCSLSLILDSTPQSPSTGTKVMNPQTGHYRSGSKRLY